jgi:hypothetical protein
MWQPLQINKKLFPHNLDVEVAQKMNDLGATDLRVLWSTEDALEAIVWVPNE